MKKLVRLAPILSLLLMLLLPGGAVQAQTRAPIIDEIAKTYGIDGYGQVDAFRYTFNIDLPGLIKLARTWTWEPKTGQITYESTDKDGKAVKVTYNRNQLNNAPADVKDMVDPAFNNDNYWFLFPFHAYWDKSAAIEDKGMQKLPLGGGSARLVSVKYPAELGGYTPGDTWDLYVGKDNRVVQFVYHRGGPKPPKLVETTWAGYKKAGPVLVSTEHRGKADGKPARIFFTGVAYKLAGSDAWVDVK